MKTSLATTLSVMGILATGGVAMAVNTTVLDSTISSVEGTPALAEANVPVSALSVDSAMPVFPINPDDALPDVSEMIVSSEYIVEGVGMVTLEQTATSLTVQSISHLVGWTYTDNSELPTRVEIEFANNARGVKFQAVLIDGRIVTAVEADVNESKGTDEVNGVGSGNEVDSPDGSDDGVDTNKDVNEGVDENENEDD